MFLKEVGARGGRRRADVQGACSVKFPGVDGVVGWWKAQDGKGLGMEHVRLRQGLPGKH